MSKNISQSELGQLIGVSGQTILNWENNIFEPKIEHLIKLADYFNVSVDEILGRTINEPIEIAASMKDKADLSQMSDKDKAYILDLIERLKGKSE